MGVLAMGYSAILKLAAGREEGEAEKCSRPVMALAVISLVAGLLLIGFLATPDDLAWRYAVVFLIGGITALLTFVYSHWRLRSGVSGSSQVFFAVGLAVLEMAFFRNYFRAGPMIYLFTAALGVWFITALLSYSGSNRAAVGIRTLALASCVIAASVALGIYHYPESPMGSLLAMDTCALVLLLSMAASLLSAMGGRLRSVASFASAVVFLGLTWWLGVLLAGSLTNDSRGGLCALVGGAAVLLLYWIRVLSPDSEEDSRCRLIGPAEGAVLSILVSVGALAMGMRWVAGFGISLAGIGGLAALALIYLIAERDPTAGSADTTDRCLASAWAVAALAAVAYVRVFLEATSWHGITVDLFETYTVPGLVLGGSLVLILAWSRAARHEAPSGVVAFLAGLAAVLVSCGVVTAVAYFWRMDAVNGFVIGIAAGAFYTIAAAALSKSAGQAAGLVLGVSVFLVTLMPALLDATINATRAHKVHILLWVLGGTALVVIATSWVRIAVSARSRVGQAA